MVIAEAMSLKIPVISTNVAGIPEMYTHGIEGFMFPEGDTNCAVNSLKLLYEDISLREDMGKAGARRFASCFDVWNLCCNVD